MGQPPADPGLGADARPEPPPRFSVPDEDWQLYRTVLEACRRRGLRFALGGGVAFSCYSGQRRWTSDLDLFVAEPDRDAFVEVVSAAGFRDYYGQKPYDRAWIFRAVQGEAIIDIIWQMANRRAAVDERWLTHGQFIELGDQEVRLVPAEELIWAKIYILQRDRCDWPDVLNVLYAQADRLDWAHLLERLGHDAPLLSGVLSVFGWLCPERAARVPAWLWRRLGLAAPPAGSLALGRSRRDLIDTRDWFGAGAQGVGKCE